MNRGLLRLAAAALAFFFSFAGFAQNSPEVALGVGWLSGQVQANGSLGNEANSVATAFQNKTETAQTLKLLASIPAALADAIGAESDANTEYLSRKAIALLLAGRGASGAVNALLLRQN